MRFVFVVSLLSVEALAFGQGFNRRYDLFGDEFAQTALGIERTSGGYCVISGSSDYDSLGVDSFFFHASVVHTFVTADGELINEVRNWRPFHSSLPGWANCCDTIPGGGYVVGGASEDTTGFDEVYLMRFNVLGDTLWTRVFGDPNGERFWIGQQVKRTTDGGYLIVGYTDQQNNWDGFALKTDSSGLESWRRIFGWSGVYSDGLASVELAAGGDLYMSGSRFMSDGTGDNWLQRTDSLGNIEWNVSWGGPFSEGSCGISIAQDGHVLVFSGRGLAPSYSEMGPYVAKVDSSDGQVIWEKLYEPHLPYTQFHTGCEALNGTIIAAGISFEQPGPSLGKGLLALTSSTGDSLWLYRYFYQDTVMQDGTGRFYDVLPTDDGGFIAAGAAYHSATIGYPEGYSQDTWVVKVDSMGCIVPGCDGTGVTEIITNLSGALTVYPNPAHGQVQVGITLPSSLRNGQDLQLTFVSASGQVALVHAAREGSNEVDIRALASGLYYVHLSNEKTWISGSKLVVE